MFTQGDNREKSSSIGEKRLFGFTVGHCLTFAYFSSKGQEKLNTYSFVDNLLIGI